MLRTRYGGGGHGIQYLALLDMEYNTWHYLTWNTILSTTCHGIQYLALLYREYNTWHYLTWNTILKQLWITMYLHHGNTISYSTIDTKDLPKYSARVEFQFHLSLFKLPFLQPEVSQCNMCSKLGGRDFPRDHCSPSDHTELLLSFIT